MIYNSLLDLIGHTPLLRLHQMEQVYSLRCRLLAKVESFNPGGSIKDRAALQMILDAEKRGVLQSGGTIIEPTSGNTGIGLAWIARLKGYQTILTMPDTMSQERTSLLKAMGAKIVLTPGKDGMRGAIQKAEELHTLTPGSIILQQFSNPSNPAAHITTAREIWEDTHGQVTELVAGVGTGGSISGTARYLRQLGAHHLQVIAVEPDQSPVLRGGTPSPHGLQGIGANFVPDNYDASEVNHIIGVTDADAVDAARLMAEKEGLLTGISSGAALHAAIEYARSLSEEHTVVVILPDSGERYLSTTLFSGE